MGSTVSGTIAAGSSAEQVAEVLSDIDGLSASATTTDLITGARGADLVNALGDTGFNFELSLDGASVIVDTTGVNDLAGLAEATNDAQASTVSAQVVSGELRIIDNRGSNLTVWL